ncbi:MAG: hypothetical protein LBJ59_12555 [Zoogloeaceae bacterium]|jgi:hypothetical protein|nr:hypothetical protein [Zoogloeaceae bacterium]
MEYSVLRYKSGELVRLYWHKTDFRVTDYFKSQQTSYFRAENDEYSSFKVITPMAFRSASSASETDKLPWKIKSSKPDDPLEKSEKSPHKLISVWNKPTELEDMINPLPFLADDKTRGKYLVLVTATSALLEVTAMEYFFPKREAAIKGGHYREKEAIKEYRYVLNGKLFKITGEVESDTRARGDEYYIVYFYPDGSREVYFSNITGLCGGVEDRIINGDISVITAYEDKLSKRHSEDELKNHKKALAYVKHVLTASEKDLEKEFDLYKSRLKPVQVSASSCSYP